MSWSPNFEENLILSNGGRPTFEQYDAQENYGLTTLRPKKASLKVNDDLYDCENDMPEVRADVRAVIELESFRRKYGLKKNTERKKWHEDQCEEDDDVESEISKIIRTSGIDHEPPSNYRPNSKNTHKAAIEIGRLPLAGEKGVFLSPNHFKFENPYFQSKPKMEAPVAKENPFVESSSKSAGLSIPSDTIHRKSFAEPSIGVSGEEYVSPAQLYLLKARRNRR